jgi:hypothetical protein
MQRTSHGPDGGSPLISVFAGLRLAMTRKSWALALISAAAVVAALGALLTSALDEGPLPEVRNTNCAVDLWPETDLEQITIGGYEFEAYEAFGRRNTRPLLLDSLEPRRCIAFIYDENLLWDPPLAITVLIDGGRIRGRWLDKHPFAPPECKTLPRETVDLKGYFHARACWAPR